jgi:hypothetical protein
MSLRMASTSSRAGTGEGLEVAPAVRLDEAVARGEAETAGGGLVLGDGAGDRSLGVHPPATTTSASRSAGARLIARPYVES